MTEEKIGTQEMLGADGGGAFAKYMRTVVGGGGLLALIRYELVISLLSKFPGAVGIWLRSKLYPLLLKQCGKGLVVGCNVAIRSPGRMVMGANVVIADGCTLDAKGSEGNGLIIGDNVFIGEKTIISMTSGTIEIGAGSNIGSSCRIGTMGYTRIGKKVLIAAYCYLVGGGHDAGRKDIPIIDQPNISKGGVVVEDGCWLGTRVTVLDGVKLGHDSILGAHSLVTKDVPEMSIAMGCPAKVVKDR